MLWELISFKPVEILGLLSAVGVHHVVRPLKHLVAALPHALRQVAHVANEADVADAPPLGRRPQVQRHGAVEVLVEGLENLKVKHALTDLPFRDPSMRLTSR